MSESLSNLRLFFTRRRGLPGNRPAAQTTAETIAARSDIPAYFGVTLYGLLNVLDGFHAPDEVVLIMTTNHAEALGAALLQPGRVDYKLFMRWQIRGGWSCVADSFRNRQKPTRVTLPRRIARRRWLEFEGLLLGLERESELVRR